MFRSILLGILLAGLPTLARAQVPAGPLSAPFLDGPHSTREGDIAARHIYGDTGSSTVAGSPLAAMVPFPTRPMVNGAGTGVSEPQVQLGPTTAFDQFTNPDAVVIGGAALPDVPPGSGVSDPSYGTSLNVVGAPYGTYNAGCLVCLFMSQDGMQANRAGVDGIDYRAGAGVIPQLGSNDVVGLYEQPQNYPARFTLAAASYTAQAVYLVKPLTPEQVSLLRQNTYLVTNSVDPTAPTGTAADGLPQNNLMMGIISGWDPAGTFITVAGWASVSGSGAVNAIPSVTSLDTAYSSYASPMVWIGAPTKVFGRNLYMNYDATKGEGAAVTSLIRRYEGEEIDFRYNSNLLNSLNFHGITISAFPLGGVGTGAVTPESYGITIAGALGRALVIQNAQSLVDIDTGSARINDLGNASPASGSTPAVPHENFEFGGQAGGSNRVSLFNTLNQIGTGQGWTGDEMDLVGVVDGTHGVPGSGTAIGGLKWNPGGNSPASVALCAQSGCGVTVAPAGTVSLGEITGELQSLTGLTSVAAGATAVASEHDIYADSNDQRLVTWSSRDVAGVAGWQSASVHIGLQIDGAVGGLAGASMGQIVFDAQNNDGGIQLCGSNACGVTVHADGSVALGTNTAPLTVVSGLTAVTPGTTAYTSEFDIYADSNVQRLITWTSRDVGGVAGWQSSSIHLGLQIDGTKGTLNGQPMGQIVWNGQGDDGGVQLCTGGGVCGVTLHTDGSVGTAVFTVGTLPSGCTPGSRAYASNGRKPGEAAGAGTGVPVTCTLSGGAPVWWSDWGNQSLVASAVGRPTRSWIDRERDRFVAWLLADQPRQATLVRVVPGPVHG